MKLAFFIPEKTTRDQIKKTRETHQEIALDQIKGVQALAHTLILSLTLPFNHCYKTPYQILPGWDTVWEQELTVSLLAWQSNKAILFCLTQNSVSKIQLSIGTQRLRFQYLWQPVSHYSNLKK